jgi:beta-lactam-binding protein with PASTA domain
MAELVLQQSGAINPNALGYFSAYPITFVWVPSSQPPATVLSQIPAQGTTVKVNSPITLTISEFPMAVISP